MDWLKNFDNIYLQGLILSGVIVALLIFSVFILYIFKIKISNKNLKYLYSFASGFLIVTALVGQWVTSRQKLTSHWTHLNEAGHSGHNHDSDPTGIQTLISISIMAIGAVIGTLTALGIKKMSVKFAHSHDSNAHISTDNTKVNHSHLMEFKHETEMELKKNNNSSKTIVWMILTHRLPAGLILGILLVNFSNDNIEFSFASMLAFILHIIPEMVIIYYSRINAGHSRFKSFIFSILVKLLLIPFIFLGIALATYFKADSNATFWIIPMLLSISGISMIWGSLFELGPVFIHSSNKDKSTYKYIFMFLLAASLSMMVQMIHVH